MSAPGFVILAHRDLHRAGALARHLARAGAPVVLHVDARAPRGAAARCLRRCRDVPGLWLAPRVASGWGGFGLVRATLGAARLLREVAPVSHVMLLSGACLPLRPLGGLRAHLDAHPDTDFIESVPIGSAAWGNGGLTAERLSLWFPVSWKRHRRVFDALTALQRRLGVARRLPPGIDPHIGSQWWCLTTATLGAILDDPERPALDRFFARSWIPDETYFQTLARRHARRIEPRSLTLCCFDPQGKPHVFHDDHRPLLEASGAFFARKAWPGAAGLYAWALDPAREEGAPSDPGPRVAAFDAPFEAARRLRVQGRPGVTGPGRFPCAAHSPQPATPGPYVVFDGFESAFPGWATALGALPGAGIVSHGRIFAPDRVELAGGAQVHGGNLPASAALRDLDPAQYLVNLLRRDSGRRIALQLAPGDDCGIRRFLAGDPNARVLRLSEAWLLDLFLRSSGAGRRASAMIDWIDEGPGRVERPALRIGDRAWRLAELVADPEAVLAAALDEAWGPLPLPQVMMVSCAGLGAFAAGLGHGGAAALIAAERAARLPRRARA